jgi:hypothetical protein
VRAVLASPSLNESSVVRASFGVVVHLDGERNLVDGSADSDNIQNVLRNLGQELSSLVEEVLSGSQEGVVIRSSVLSVALGRNGEARRFDR